MRAIVVEDNANLGRVITQLLGEERYVVDLQVTCERLFPFAARGEHDLVVLEKDLPEVDGLSVCRALRQRGFCKPVLMLTARAQVAERVLCLDAGADDALAKPFDVSELRARVRALARRASGHARLRCGELEIDRIERQAYVAGKRVLLTSREFALLLRLAARAGEVVDRSDLQQMVWQSPYEAGSNYIEVHMSRLRSKLEDHAAMIETVRGLGYRMRGDAASA